MNLDTLIRYVKGIGPERARLFNKLEVYTIEDLLNHFPREYVFPITNFEQRIAEIVKWKQEKIILSDD